jgi:hypothetical protein
MFAIIYYPCLFIHMYILEIDKYLNFDLNCTTPHHTFVFLYKNFEPNATFFNKKNLSCLFHFWPSQLILP